jgi:aconitase A
MGFQPVSHRQDADATTMSIFDAAMKYQADGIPWSFWRDMNMAPDRAAIGPRKASCSGQAVVAASFERIHRSNLVS